MPWHLRHHREWKVLASRSLASVPCPATGGLILPPPSQREAGGISDHPYPCVYVTRSRYRPWPQDHNNAAIAQRELVVQSSAPARPRHGGRPLREKVRKPLSRQLCTASAA